MRNGRGGGGHGLRECTGVGAWGSAGMVQELNHGGHRAPRLRLAGRAKAPVPTQATTHKRMPYMSKLLAVGQGWFLD